MRTAGRSLSPRLRQLLADDAAIVRFGFPAVLRPFVMRNVIGITLGRTIYLSTSLQDAGEQELEQLLLHELQHVRQVRRHGLIPFLYLYLREFSENLAHGLGVNEAYRRISFEREAREAEQAAECSR